MQLTINIKDKEINDAIATRVLWDVIDEYSEESRIAAGVTQATAAKLLREDAKFMASLTKQLTQSLQDLVDDILFDCVNEAVSPELKKLHTQLAKAEKVVDKKAAAEKQAQADRDEAERLAKAIEALTKMGYKITKE